jgi:hypothetical protein
MHGLVDQVAGGGDLFGYLECWKHILWFCVNLRFNS